MINGDFNDEARNHSFHDVELVELYLSGELTLLSLTRV